MGPTVHTKSIHLPIFTNNTWSYLLWPPVMLIVCGAYIIAPVAGVVGWRNTNNAMGGALLLSTTPSLDKNTVYK